MIDLRKTKKSDISLFVIVMLLFCVLFVNQLFSILKYAFLFVVGVYLITKLRTYFIKKYFYLNLVILLYGFFVIFTSLWNRSTNIDRDTFLASIVYVGSIVEIFFLMEYIVEKNKLQAFFHAMFMFLLVYVLVCDLMFFTSGSSLVAGGKFTISYLHLQLIIAMLLDDKVKEKNIVLFILIVLSFVVIVMVSCNTGVLGLVLLLILYLFRRKISFLCKPTVAVVSVIAISLIAILIGYLISLPFVEWLVVQVLGRDLTLTGRVGIYEKFAKVMSGHWVHGFGYGSGYDVCMKYLRYADIQNGFLEIVLETGIVGGGLFLALIAMSIRSNAKLKPNKTMLLTIIIVYVYIFMGIVEITFNLHFILWITIFFAASSTLNKKQDLPLRENIGQKIREK